MAVLEIKTLRNRTDVIKALKEHCIPMKYFKQYGFLNNIPEDNIFFIGMGKWNGVYDYKIGSFSNITRGGKNGI